MLQPFINTIASNPFAVLSLPEPFVIILDQQFLIQLGFQLLNTAVLCFILAKLLYKPVKKFLADRKEKIANQIDSAQAKLEEAEKLKAEYELKISGIEKERDEILEQARSKGKKREEQIIAEAKEEAETLKSRAMLDIQREQEKAKDEIKKQIIEVSSLVASRFIAASMDDAAQDKLVDEVIADLGEVKWQN